MRERGLLVIVASAVTVVSAIATLLEDDTASPSSIARLASASESFLVSSSLAPQEEQEDTTKEPIFATADGCALCHSASSPSEAMRDETGRDVSPHSLWKGTLMANSLRDPYFRAQLARERATHPERQGEIEGLCLRCHAPMAHHTARLHESGPTTLAKALADPLGQDGVSCTVCHKVPPEKLGAEETFDGQLNIGRERKIYGPYASPFTRPMLHHTGFTPTEGTHIRQAELCAGCHTLRTEEPKTGSHFLEQAPYLEWRNSAFARAGVTCQKCHMPGLEEPTRIARNPRGGDFPPIRPRPDYREHAFLGANAFMLDLLKENAEAVGMPAGREGSLAKNAAATRRFLASRSARVTLDGVKRSGTRLSFGVQVQNLSGHKLPTGYPSRRAWLEVRVRADGKQVFHSGGTDGRGALLGVKDERGLPHRNSVSSPEQVVVYECTPVGADGTATTMLTDMVRMAKDSRLLPRGWDPKGPAAAETKPIGVGEDPDFGPGGDRVSFDIPLAGAFEKIEIQVAMHYQTVPPSWVAPLRELELEEAQKFVKMYDATGGGVETLAETQFVLK
jgi:hypothetical protein